MATSGAQRDIAGLRGIPSIPSPHRCQAQHEVHAVRPVPDAQVQGESQ
jgi:hypothetical protein